MRGRGGYYALGYLIALHPSSARNPFLPSLQKCEVMAMATVSRAGGLRLSGVLVTPPLAADDAARVRRMAAGISPGGAVGSPSETDASAGAMAIGGGEAAVGPTPASRVTAPAFGPASTPTPAEVATADATPAAAAAADATPAAAADATPAAAAADATPAAAADATPAAAVAAAAAEVPVIDLTFDSDDDIPAETPEQRAARLQQSRKRKREGEQQARRVTLVLGDDDDDDFFQVTATAAPWDSYQQLPLGSPNNSCPLGPLPTAAPWDPCPSLCVCAPCAPFLSPNPPPFLPLL